MHAADFLHGTQPAKELDRMRTTFLALVAVVSMCGGVAQASPILAGQVVEVTYLFPDTSTVFPGGGPIDVTVGAGVELLDFAGFADIDISDTNILITARRNAGINPVPFDGFRFVDIFGTIPNDLTAVLNPATTYAGFTDSRFAGGDQDTLFVNVADLPGLSGQVISIDLVEPAVGTVPEPATLTLLGGGLATLIARRRTSKRRE